jgi:hypothetical protein
MSCSESGNNTYMIYIIRNPILWLGIHCFFYLFFIIGNPSRHFVYITKKSSPVNIVSRKINRQNPASISTYTQSEYRISNYVNHISIITWFTAGHGVSFIESRHEIDEKVVESSQIEDACRLKHYRWVNLYQRVSAICCLHWQCLLPHINIKTYIEPFRFWQSMIGNSNVPTNFT